MGVRRLHGVGCHCAMSCHALPHDAVVVMPAVHTCVLEVPQDRLEHAQPLDVEHHIVSL
jgi:hypothetical protein